MAKGKNCKWLKDVDQTGIPVTLNWQKENVHNTRCGGIVSIFGSILVLSFVIGSVQQFLTFSQINQNTN